MTNLAKFPSIAALAGLAMVVAVGSARAEMPSFDGAPAGMSEMLGQMGSGGMPQMFSGGAGMMGMSGMPDMRKMLKMRGMPKMPRMKMPKMPRMPKMPKMPDVFGSSLSGDASDIRLGAAEIPETLESLSGCATRSFRTGSNVLVNRCG